MTTSARYWNSRKSTKAWSLVTSPGATYSQPPPSSPSPSSPRVRLMSMYTPSTLAWMPVPCCRPAPGKPFAKGVVRVKGEELRAGTGAKTLAGPAGPPGNALPSPSPNPDPHGSAAKFENWDWLEEKSAHPTPTAVLVVVLVFCWFAGWLEKGELPEEGTSGLEFSASPHATASAPVTMGLAWNVASFRKKSIRAALESTTDSGSGPPFCPADLPPASAPFPDTGVCETSWSEKVSRFGDSDAELLSGLKSPATPAECRVPLAPMTREAEEFLGAGTGLEPGVGGGRCSGPGVRRSGCDDTGVMSEDLRLCASLLSTSVMVE